jgi:hypothetical protein
MAGAGALFLFIFISGFWLSRSGKPYGTLLFTIHKLVALSAVLLLGWTAYQAQQSTPFTPLQIAALAAAGVSVLALFVTGALLSIDKTMPEFVRSIHHAAPYLALLSSAAGLYLLL